MKVIDYVYVNIFRWYYKDGLYNRKADPNTMTAFMFGIWLGGLGMLASFIYSDLTRHVQFYKIKESAMYITIICSILFAILINEFYLKQNRYLNLYHSYISKNKMGNKYKGIVYSFLFILLPYLLLGIYGIIKVIT